MVSWPPSSPPYAIIDTRHATRHQLVTRCLCRISLIRHQTLAGHDIATFEAFGLRQRCHYRQLRRRRLPLSPLRPALTLLFIIHGLFHAVNIEYQEGYVIHVNTTQYATVE